MIAIILLAYGMPQSLDQIESFYTDIYHGKTPSSETLNAAHQRFRQFGVVDPLYSVTMRQARALQHKLQAAGHEKVQTYIGALHTSPFVGEAVEKAVRDGADKIIALPTSLLYSKSGVGRYINLVKEGLSKRGAEIPVLGMTHWCHDDAIVDLLADRLQIAVEWLPKDTASDTKVIFTAHSKTGIESAHTDYIDEFTTLARNVAERANVRDWRLAYRSAGPPPQRWLGPDLLEVIEEEGKSGTKAIVTCDLLSITENIEVLRDIGIEAKNIAEAYGLEFVRTEFLNDADDFMRELSRIILERMQQDDFL